MADEIIGLRLDLSGEEEYAQAAENVHRLEREFAGLQLVIERNAPGWEQARQRIGQVRQELEALRAIAERTSTAMVGMSGQGGPAVGASAATTQMIAAQGWGRPSGAGAGLDQQAGWLSRNAGQLSMTMLMVGQAADDAQYGFRGLANNLPTIGTGITQLLGGSGTLGLAIGGLTAIVATAGYQLYQYSGSFKRFIGTIGESLGQFASVVTFGAYTPTPESMTRQQATADADRKRAEEAVKSVRGIRSEEDEARIKQFQEAVKTFGGERLIKSMGGDEGTVGALLGRAGRGDAAALADINSLLKGRDLAAWKDALREASEETKESRAVAKREAADILDARIREARSVEELQGIQDELRAEYRAGNATLTEHYDRLKRVNGAMEQIGEQEEKLAAERKKANDEAVAEAIKAGEEAGGDALRREIAADPELFHKNRMLAIGQAEQQQQAAMREAGEADLRYLETVNPAMARMMRSQMAMQGRMGGAGGGMNRAMRAMNERMMGGAAGVEAFQRWQSDRMAAELKGEDAMSGAARKIEDAGRMMVDALRSGIVL